MSDHLATVLAVVKDAERQFHLDAGKPPAFENRDLAYAKIVNSHGMDILTNPEYHLVAQPIYDHIRDGWGGEHSGHARTEKSLTELVRSVIPGLFLLGGGGNHGSSFEVHVESADMCKEQVCEKTAAILARIQQTYLSTISPTAELSIYVKRSRSPILGLVTHTSITRTQAGDWQVFRLEGGGGIARFGVRGTVNLHELLQELLSA